MLTLVPVHELPALRLLLVILLLQNELFVLPLVHLLQLRLQEPQLVQPLLIVTKQTDSRKITKLEKI